VRDPLVMMDKASRSRATWAKTRPLPADSLIPWPCYCVWRTWVGRLPTRRSDSDAGAAGVRLASCMRPFKAFAHAYGRWQPSWGVMPLATCHGCNGTLRTAATPAPLPASMVGNAAD
jgi:hypothetical protein